MKWVLPCIRAGKSKGVVHVVSVEFSCQPIVAVVQSDISLASPSALKAALSRTGGAAVAELPGIKQQLVEMMALIETEFREHFIEIRELHAERRVVTGIEILSPSNKRYGSPGWYKYFRKRQTFLEGGPNFVEIDLLRGGRRMPMEDEWPCSPYYLLVARKQQAPRCMVWPAHFAAPLPVIPVPLASPDPDVPLDIQPMIAAIAERSRYDREIDYRQPPRPPLDPAETAWLKERLETG